MSAISSNSARLRVRAAALRATSLQLWQLASDIDSEIIEQEPVDAVSTSANELSPQALLAQTEATYKARRRREKLLGAKLFADPAWDMLLTLYADYLAKRRVSVSSLCIASMAPNTTALRWIKQLVEVGLVEKMAFVGDGRVQHLTLSEAGQRAMSTYFSEQIREAGKAADSPLFFRNTP